MRSIFILIFLLVFSTPALAHPADDLCLPGQDQVVDICVAPDPRLGLDNPEYYQCWRHYQHLRRILDERQKETYSLVKQVNEYVSLNNIVAAQCAARKCSSNYKPRATFDFPETQICYHVGFPEQTCGFVNLFTDYWAVIPMEILSRFPADQNFCEASVMAAEQSIAFSDASISAANQRLVEEKTEFFRRSRFTFR